MSEPIDDKTFEEYLSRESQLSERYSGLATDEVPAQLDGLILAQAREAVAAKPASSRRKPAWMRWTPPLALAASMVLVISIVIESGTQHEVTTRDMAATMPQGAATASDSPAKEKSDALSAEPQQLSAIEPEPPPAPAAPGRAPVMVELKKSVVPPAEIVVEERAEVAEARTAAVAAEKPPSPEMKIEVPAPAITAATARNAAAARRETLADVETDASSLDEIVIAGNRVQPTRGAGQGAGPRGTITPPSVARSPEASQEALLQRFRQSDPQRWLEYIRELRRNDKGAQADREWRNFLKAYPDYKVDEKDVARARQ